MNSNQLFPALFSSLMRKHISYTRVLYLIISVDSDNTVQSIIELDVLYAALFTFLIVNVF